MVPCGAQPVAINLCNVAATIQAHEFQDNTAVWIHLRTEVETHSTLVCDSYEVRTHPDYSTR
jgi:hypothetical protein